MLRQGMFVRFRQLNFTGQILFLIFNPNDIEQFYLVHIRQGKGNEKVEQFFKTDFMCQCREDDLEFVCLN